MSFGLVVGTLINSRIHVESLIEENFFLKLRDGEDNDKSQILKRFEKITNNLRGFNFNNQDRFSEVKWAILGILCCKKPDESKIYLNRSEKIFVKAFHSV